MPFSFKHATEEDAQAVHELIQLAFAEYIDTVPVEPSALKDTVESVRDALRAGTTILLFDGESPLALVDGMLVFDYSKSTLVGTARYELKPEHLYIGRVAVHPEHRRRGIGEALMKHIEGLAPSLGYTKLYLATRASMPGNLVFYKRLGYTIALEEPNPRGPDINVWFEKNLTNVDTRETLLSALTEQLQELPGSQVIRVIYSGSQYEIGALEDYHLDAPLLNLDSELALYFDNEAARYISWGSHRGWGGGAAYSTHISTKSFFNPESRQSIDIGQRSAWRPFLGQSIRHIDVLGSDGLPFACRFAFDTGNIYVGTGSHHMFCDGDDVIIATEEGWLSQNSPEAELLAHLVPAGATEGSFKT